MLFSMQGNTNSLSAQHHSSILTFASKKITSDTEGTIIDLSSYTIFTIFWRNNGLWHNMRLIKYSTGR